MIYTVTDVKNQINNMIYLNTLSFSALSGCGNDRHPHKEEQKELEALYEGKSMEDKPYNVFFMESLYQRGLSQYAVSEENPFDFNSYRWTDKKKKKNIDIDVMAHSIIACCNLTERLLTCDLPLENPQLHMYILYKTAQKQASFIKKHLKVGNIFYNGEDVTPEGSKEQHIQITSSNPDRLSQFTVLHASAALMQLSCYNLNTIQDNHLELIDELSILPFTLDELSKNMDSTSTKELCMLGLQICEIYRKSSVYSDLLRNSLRKLYKVLCQRVNTAGTVLRNIGVEEPASFSTSANCLNLLSRLAYVLANKTCYDTAHKIYQQLAASWHEEGKTFRIKDSNKQSYKISDLASLMAALFSFNRIVHEDILSEELYKTITFFAETAFVKSGIFNGQSRPLLQQGMLELHEELRYDPQWAPTFNKSFEYKINKGKYYCEAEVFRADYVMPACTLLLDSINN